MKLVDIDDILCNWIEAEHKLKIFLQHLNTFHPNLKFIHEKSRINSDNLRQIFRVSPL